MLPSKGGGSTDLNCYEVLMKRIVSMKSNILVLKNRIVFKKDATYSKLFKGYKWQKLNLDSLSKKGHLFLI